MRQRYLSKIKAVKPVYTQKLINEEKKKYMDQKRNMEISYSRRG